LDHFYLISFLRIFSIFAYISLRLGNILDRKFISGHATHFFRAYFWKKIALLNSLTLSVYPSVLPEIFKFWILRENYLSTRNTALFFDPKPRSSGTELRLGPSQIKVFPYISSISEKQSMFFNWYHKVVVKYKYFTKKNFLGSSWLQFRIQLFPLRKTEQGVV
jgi:hypothetical protein